MISIPEVSHFEEWRTHARQLLQAGTPPEQVLWQGVSELSLFGSQADEPSSRESVQKLELRVPKDFVEKARCVAQVRESSRWDLLYRLLYRLQFETPHLLKITTDPEVHRFEVLYKQVTRDIHKMHAFVRFKKVVVDGLEYYKAWHSPEHAVTELAAPFFVRRFGDKPWSIFTPDISVHWNGTQLSNTAGIPQHQFEHQDEFDMMWKSYYRSIFNPARLKLKAMKAEMPTHFWNSLPEAELIPDLIRQAPSRLQVMAENQNQRAMVPAHDSLRSLAKLSHQCQACPLYKTATHVVFGEGPASSEMMIVGEQPGDTEDLEGKPFVGPAGQILNECLQLAGLHREALYLTNAVKHFKWERNGKMRLHKKASGQEMHACKPWLEAEIKLVKPKLILALGVTAGTAVLGRLPKISSERGKVFHDQAFADLVLLSWHPSAILRSNSPEERQQRMNELAQDLRLAASLLENTSKKSVEMNRIIE